MRLAVCLVCFLFFGALVSELEAVSAHKRLLSRPRPKFADVNTGNGKPAFDNAPGSDKIGSTQSGVTVVTNNNKLDQILHIGDDEDDDDKDGDSADGHDITAASLENEPSKDGQQREGGRGEEEPVDDGVMHTYEQAPHADQKGYINGTNKDDKPAKKVHFKKYDGGKVGDLSKHEISQFLNTMNRARAEVGVPELEWSEELQFYAGRWVKRLAENHCDLEHSPALKGGKPYGENLAWFGGYTGDPKAAVENWLAEKAIYDKDGPEKCMRPHAHHSCGHYTQVVWRDTLRVGCAIATCGKSAVYSCNFDPIGNYVGKKPF